MKMRVSDEMIVFLVRRALVHVLDWRKMGRRVSVSSVASVGAWRAAREVGDRVPMWYAGIIAFAVSESGWGISDVYLRGRRNVRMAMNSSVASWPAAPMILVAPPGCPSRKAVPS